MVNLLTKFEVSTFTRYGQSLKMHKIEWFGVVRGHPRSSAMSSFDRAHTMKLCVFLVLFSRYGELFVEIC